MCGLSPFAESLVCDNNDFVSIFVIWAKMQLHQGNENQNKLKLTWGCVVILQGHDEYAWGQRSIQEHIWPSEVTINM